MLEAMLARTLPVLRRLLLSVASTRCFTPACVQGSAGTATHPGVGGLARGVSDEAMNYETVARGVGPRLHWSGGIPTG
jgi:hypothetical protein